MDTATLDADLRELSAEIGAESVITEKLSAYANDATEHAGLVATPEAVLRPTTVDDVRTIVSWAHERRISLIPRGGGTGFSGGAVAVQGGVIVDLSRLDRVLCFDPEFWRMHVQAGVLTATVQRLARESGLYFPPDPGAAEQSQIGGNVATNAGGPHAFKYGVTGQWVTGIEAVVPPGEVVQFGGSVRKDVAAYDMMRLLIGSEGTLGIITAAWLRLIPAPAASLPLVAGYRDNVAGCAAIQNLICSGVPPAAIEFLDSPALAASVGSFPQPLPNEAGFLVITEADGTALEVQTAVADLREALAEDSVMLWAPSEPREIKALWRWRDGVSLAVAAQRGGKVSEDIAVPLDRLLDAIEAAHEIGQAYELPVCNWGHAGDGNLHSTFMVDPDDKDELERALTASHELRKMALGLSGTISGEHGIGWLKRGDLSLQLGGREFELHRQLKQLFDPRGIMNPGKKQ